MTGVWILLGITVLLGGLGVTLTLEDAAVFTPQRENVAWPDESLGR